MQAQHRSKDGGEGSWLCELCLSVIGPLCSSRSLWLACTSVSPRHLSQQSGSVSRFGGASATAHRAHRMRRLAPAPVRPTARTLGRGACLFRCIPLPTEVLDSPIPQRLIAVARPRRVARTPGRALTIVGRALTSDHRLSDNIIRLYPTRASPVRLAGK